MRRDWIKDLSRALESSLCFDPFVTRRGFNQNAVLSLIITRAKVSRTALLAKNGFELWRWMKTEQEETSRDLCLGFCQRTNVPSSSQKKITLLPRIWEKKFLVFSSRLLCKTRLVEHLSSVYNLNCSQLMPDGFDCKFCIGQNKVENRHCPSKTE